jgi:hypothetical protein
VWAGLVGTLCLAEHKGPRPAPPLWAGAFPVPVWIVEAIQPILPATARTRGLDIAINAKRQVADAAMRRRVVRNSRQGRRQRPARIEVFERAVMEEHHAGTNEGQEKPGIPSPSS